MSQPSNHGWPFGFIPTAQEWADAFSGKVDFPAPLSQGGTGGSDAYSANYAIQQRAVISTSGQTAFLLTQYGLDTNSVALTVNLPPVSDGGNGDWITFTDFRYRAATNNITLQAHGSEQISYNGVASGTLVLSTNGVEVVLTLSGGTWYATAIDVGDSALKANASAVGVAPSANNMGTFTGGIIPSGQTAKQALQSLSDGVSLRVLATVLAAAGGAALVGTQDAANAQADLNTRVIRVSTRTTMKALNVTRFGVASLQEAGREGTFSLKTGTAPTDTLEGVYVVSNTAGYYWEREWDGIIAKAEWFGAVLNNGGVDSYAALQACLNVTGKLYLPTGSYYSSAGLLLPDNAVVWGQGALFSGITFSTATGHLMRQQGVSGTSYKAGANLADFALGRTPNPTTPGSVAGDISQGHGLSFFMVSNPRVRSVYTYNNLVELYVNNVLSPDIVDVRGIRQTGSGSDRWYGCYVDGVTTGGTFGGPSPNPSTTITKPNMVSNASVGTCYHYYLNGAIQDLWMVDPEAAGQGGTSVQFFLNINGATAGDVHIVRPIADGYKTNGINVKGAPVGSSINIVDAWVAPSASATSTGVVIDASHGVNISGRSDFASASGLACVTANDCTELDCNFRSNNSQTPFSATSMSSSNVLIKAFKNFAGGGGSFGNIITLIGGSQNRVAAYGTVSPNGSPQLWAAGIALNDTAANCQLDVSGVPASSVVNRLTISGAAVTTQGTVGTHFVINPGAAGGTAGTVTSVQVSGGSTGLTASGGPITSSGTFTLGGTLALESGGTGATTAADARTALGLGTAATANTGTTGTTVPLLSGANTWSSPQQFQQLSAYANSAGVSLGVTGGFNYFDGKFVWRASPGGTELGQVTSAGLSYSSNGGQVLFGLSGSNNYIDGTLYVRGTVNGSTVAQFAPSTINFYQGLNGTSATFSGNASCSQFNCTVLNASAVGYMAGLQVSGTSVGYTTVYQGDASNTGYIAYWNAAGVRQGYIGYATTGGPIRYVSDTGGGHLFIGGAVNVNRAAGNTDVALFENTSSGSALNGIVSKIQSGGNNTSSFHFAGVTNGVNLWYLYGNGTSSYISDARIKNRFEPARDGYLEDWKRLEFQRWNYKHDPEGTPKNLGPTAQNVKKVFPSLAPQSLHDITIDGVSTKTLQVMGSVLYGEVLGKVVQELAFALEKLQTEVVDLRLKIENNFSTQQEK